MSLIAQSPARGFLETAPEQSRDLRRALLKSG
jgi:hypothetical protein